MTTNPKVPAARRATSPNVSVPRELVEQTLALLLQVPSGQSYLLVRRWDDVIPGLIQPVAMSGGSA